jgi:2-hydroxychromene-2-carboxylate isomerase
VWKPLLLGGLFKDIGQVEAPVLTWGESKRDHTFKDLKRWADYFDVPFKFPSRFPMLTIKALRVYLALPEDARRGFRERTYRAYWAEDRDIADDATLRDTMRLEKAAADEIFARIQTPEIKQALIEATKEAVKRGVFGAPTWFIDGGDPIWGQDRIPIVERALSM